MKAAATWEEISSLTPWDQNPRINDGSVLHVAKSIERFGFGAPIIARQSDRVVIAGHTRLKAAKKLGLDKVPVRFLDLDPAQSRALALADNKLGELADWNNDMLRSILTDLQDEEFDLDGLGWSEDELDALIQQGDPMTDGDADEAPGLTTDIHSKLGEVYELGPHRLVCGDATTAEAWDLLLPGNEMLRAVWSDPPYGVAYVGKTKDALTIENDDLNEEALLELLDNSLGHAFHACEVGAAWYVASPPGDLFYVFATALKKLEVWRHTLTWVKDRFVMGRCDYHYRHEAIFYGWKPGGPHYWSGRRDLDTLLMFNRPDKNKHHPTMKPVALIEHCLENSSQPGWLVGDPFGGSGSTLMACARLGRRARLIELDPQYCDVIRRRWTMFANLNGVDPGSGQLEPNEDF